MCFQKAQIAFTLRDHAIHLCPEMQAIARITNITTVLRKIPKITIIAKITKITNQGSHTGKYNRSLKESMERCFTNVTKITEITIHWSHTGKYNKSLKESRERGFTNVTNVTKTYNYSKNNENNKSKEPHWQQQQE